MEAIYAAPLMETAIPDIVPLVVAFRQSLLACGAATHVPDEQEAADELSGYLEHQWPVYAVWLEGVAVGYAVARVEDDTVWLESLYLAEPVRRLGLGSLLFKTVEELAGVLGESTVYNYVHPLNRAMISFLKKHGYDVLNLLEIRKAGSQETLPHTLEIAGNVFRI